MDSEEVFWNLAVSKGLPWFRFFRRSIPVGQLDSEFQGQLKPEWESLKANMQVGDEIWPFRFYMRATLGMRSGYIVLRRGKPIGGIITLVS